MTVRFEWDIRLYEQDNPAVTFEAKFRGAPADVPHWLEMMEAFLKTLPQGAGAMEAAREEAAP